MCNVDAGAEGEGLRLPLSALNQYLFCPRRAALIHIEQQFDENAATVEGRVEHERVDQEDAEQDDGLRREYAVPLFHRQLGLVGKSDLIEFHGDVPFPVDHKRGRRRKWDNDDVQLCGQALCLEDMLGVEVPAGAIFHVRSRRRREVSFTPELRQLTEQTIEQVRELFLQGRTPAPKLMPRCDGCSMRERCLPELLTDPTRLRTVHQELFH